MTSKNYIKLNPNDLVDFYGTTQLYYLPTFKNLVYTDGIRYLANNYKAYFLIIDIAALLPIVIKKHPDWFYVVILRQHNIGQLELIFTDGNDNTKPIYCHKYDITNLEIVGCQKDDTPINEMKFFLQRGENNFCLMLPSEY